MALSDKWTRAQFRTAIRRELMDSGTKWWTDLELNNYIGAWQDRVNDELEFTAGTASAAIGSATQTVTLTDVATDILRPAIVCWNNVLLSPLTIEELNNLNRNWRNVTVGGDPAVIYQETYGEVGLFPPPGADGTLTFEYPMALAFSTDTSTSDLPPWTRYSAIDYACYRAYMRNGANMDVNRAKIYKANFTSKLRKYSTLKRKYLPAGYSKFTPGNEFEVRMVQPSYGGSTMAIIAPSSLSFLDEVPTGTVNAINDTFTLTQTPASGSLKLYVDGVLMQVTTHYTLSTKTITFETAFIPNTGQAIFASYRY